MESPPEGYPRHPPPLREPLPHISTCWTVSADRKCDIYVWESLTGGGGGRGDLRNGAIQ